MPVRSSRALLITFSLVPIIVITIYSNSKPNFLISLPEIVNLTLFYISCSLVYIITYSAIEQHSPTLSIITHINSHGEVGCEDECILRHINPGEEINKRLAIMKEVGWIIDNNGNCILTKSGSRIALIFSLGAFILGLEKGG